MKPVFQTTFGYPTGNCFNAAVASVLELDKLPDIDPTLPDDQWAEGWCRFLDEEGLKWESRSCEPELNNWDMPFNPDVAGHVIAHVEVLPGILHAVVCAVLLGRAVPVHDVGGTPGFEALPHEKQRRYRCVSYSWFVPLEAGQRNGFTGAATADFAPAERA